MANKKPTTQNNKKNSATKSTKKTSAKKSTTTKITKIRKKSKKNSNLTLLIGIFLIILGYAILFGIIIYTMKYQNNNTESKTYFISNNNKLSMTLYDKYEEVDITNTEASFTIGEELIYSLLVMDASSNRFDSPDLYLSSWIKYYKNNNHELNSTNNKYTVLQLNDKDVRYIEFTDENGHLVMFGLVNKKDYDDKYVLTYTSFANNEIYKNEKKNIIDMMKSININID